MTKIGLVSRQLAVLSAFCILSPLFSGSMIAAASPSAMLRTGPAGEPYVPPPSTLAPAQLWPSGISFGPRTKSPFVQDDLNLGYTFTYDLNFNIRAHSTNAAEQTRPAPDGWYALNLVVLEQDPLNTASPHERFVTSATPMLVRVSNYSLSKRIQLSFRNLASTVRTTLLYVELTPLQNNCGQQTCIRLQGNGLPDVANSVQRPLPGFKPFLVELRFVGYRGLLESNPDSDSMATFRNPFRNQPLSQFIVEAEAALERSRRRSAPQSLSPEDYALKNNLYLLDVNGLEFQTLAQGLMPGVNFPSFVDSLLKQPGLSPSLNVDSARGFLSVLCNAVLFRNRQYGAKVRQGYLGGRIRVYTQPETLVEQCVAKANKYLALTRNSHFSKINKSRPLASLFSTNLRLSPMQNFTAGHTSSSSNQASTTFSGTLGPVSFGQSVSETEDFAKGRWMIASLSKTLDFNPLGLSIPVANLRNCLEVRVVNEKADFLYDTSPNAKNGLYLCTQEIADGQVQELYAHIYDRNEDSSTTLANDPESQALNTVQRGDRNISYVFYSLRQAFNPDQSPTQFQKLLEAAAKAYFSTAQSGAANMVIQPIQIPGLENKASVISGFGQRGVLTFRDYFRRDLQ